MVIPDMRTLPLNLAALTVVAALFTWSSTAQAAIPPELRPGTKPHYFEFGPTFNFGFLGDGPYGGPGAAAILDYRYHFQGGAEGPSLGVLSTVGGWSNRFHFSAGPMFEWDFKLVGDKPLGLYLGPHIAAGYHISTHKGDPAYHAFTTMLGPTLKLIVNDFWVFWVRPANFEMRFAGDIYGSWSGALGAGITWG
jgi:hypothetical protein